MTEDFTFNIRKRRPEETYNHVIDYFKGDILSDYANSKSKMKIQEKLTNRALELLNLKKSKSLILDAGTGPGFAAIYLKERGLRTVAIDLIPAFLYYYKFNEINPVIGDMCFPPFQPEIFDAIISISALQWVFRELGNIKMESSLINLSKSFYQILKPNSSVVFQFYPKSESVMKQIGKIIIDNTLFKGNFVIDNPKNPKKRKIFLLLKKGKVT